MKLTYAVSAVLAGLVSAVPTPTLTEDGPLDGRTVEKRATITDACPVGYCTMNGGYDFPMHILLEFLFSCQNTGQIERFGLLLILCCVMAIQYHRRRRRYHDHCVEPGLFHGCGSSRG